MPWTRLTLALLLAASSLAVQARDYAYSDAHLHYVDFFQETAGMDKLLKAMADNRIEHVMISGIPVAKKWHEDEPKRPRYYAGDDADAYWYSATDVIVAAAVNNLTPEQRQHFHPFLSGFNPNDKNSDAHIQRMLDLNPGLWQGIGEVFTRHDDLTAITAGDTPRANNEAMTRIYHLAAENDLPVLLHSISPPSASATRCISPRSRSRCATIHTPALSGPMPAPARKSTGIRCRWTFCCRR